MDDIDKAFEELSKVAETKSEMDELRDEVNRLKRDNIRLLKTLEEYGIDEQSPITDVELICTIGIEKYKKLAEECILTEKDAKTIDLLHKNLRAARGKMEIKKPKGKDTSVADLIKIVEGGNE